MTNTVLTLHDPEAARRYYAAGLSRADTLRSSGELIWPALGVMQNGDYLNHIVSNAIGHDVGRAGDHKLAGALDAPLPADHRKFLQALHSYPNSLDYARCSVRMV